MIYREQNHKLYLAEILEISMLQDIYIIEIEEKILLKTKMGAHQG